MCLIARALEARGLPTMILGSALDITQAGRPPRLSFLDYPLGHSAGRPGDAAEQLAVVRAALEALPKMAVPESVSVLPYRWADDEAWQETASDSSGDDQRQPRDESPRYQFEADRLLAEGA